MDYTGKLINKNPPQPTQASASGVWTLDEAAAAVRNNSWPIPGVPNPISKSLRFNSADSAYLNRTPPSAGNRRTWTFSFWLKRTTLGTTPTETIFCTNDNDLASGNFDNIRFTTTGGITDKLEFYSYSTGYSIRLITTQVFRDPSAWYHFVIAVDTTQATASNRAKIYLNGSQITAFSTETYPSQNYETYINNAERQNLGVLRNVNAGLSQYLNGYMTEFYNIDGQALTPSSFGQTNANTGVWEPKPYTGTYGTNGFYLNFKDSATTTALGYDYSGNGNNWTPNNFSVTAGAGNDSLVDVPTQWIGYNTSGDTGGIWRGNYCTWNPLDTLAAAVANYTNGNLNTAYTAANYTGRATMAVTTGKWYWEITVTTTGNPIGIATAAAATNQYPGQNASSWGYYENGNKYTNGSASAYGNSYTTGDVIGVAFDADGGNLYFYKNGTVQNSGTAAFTSLTSGPYFPAIGNGVYVANFGQRPFAYTPPAGFLSLCTTNLPTPTIGATSTTLADDYFNTITWSGTNGARTFTGVGFQPDFVWGKTRNGSGSHMLYDAVRGAGASKALASNVTDAEGLGVGAGSPALYGYLSAFTSDGFSVADGTDPNPSLADAFWNDVSLTYVAWNWKANGAGSSNTAGSISSTVSANTTAGFSIVTYTGTGANATVGHGCLVNNVATAPSMIIVKCRNAATSWRVYHTSIGNTGAVYLNTTVGTETNSVFWNNTSPTSSVFTVGTDLGVNASSNTFVAYCFAPVAGYSAFGSYTGNGSSDGPFIYTGFRPAWVLVKVTSTSGYDWYLMDDKRPGYNVISNRLVPNTSNAEITTGDPQLDIVSNGFKLRTGNSNASSVSYIYMALAANPFKYSLAR